MTINKIEPNLNVWKMRRKKQHHQPPQQGQHSSFPGGFFFDYGPLISTKVKTATTSLCV